jgi:hypothetical protein
MVEIRRGMRRACWGSWKWLVWGVERERRMGGDLTLRKDGKAGIPDSWWWYWVPSLLRVRSPDDGGEADCRSLR